MVPHLKYCLNSEFDHLNGFWVFLSSIDLCILNFLKDARYSNCMLLVAFLMLQHKLTLKMLRGAIALPVHFCKQTSCCTEVSALYFSLRMENNVEVVRHVSGNHTSFTTEWSICEVLWLSVSSSPSFLNIWLCVSHVRLSCLPVMHEPSIHVILYAQVSRGMFEGLYISVGLGFLPSRMLSMIYTPGLAQTQMQPWVWGSPAEKKILWVWVWGKYWWVWDRVSPKSEFMGEFHFCLLTCDVLPSPQRFELAMFKYLITLWST